jgi:4-amino-4-deoxy-L-arabinose transferase-like glycosyltransferase
MPSRRILIVLVLVAVAIRGIVLAADSDEYELSGLSATGGEVARVIVERGEWFRTDPEAAGAIGDRQDELERLIDPEGFDYPPDSATNAELVTPQGAALILAASWKLTGSERYIWLQLLQVLIGAALTVAVAWISAKLFGRPRAAAFAAALWAVSPALAFFAKIPLYEIWAVYAAVGLTAAYLVAREREAWWPLALVGLGIALATLFRQSLILLPFAFAAGELLVPRRAARTLAIVGAACVVGLIPWTIRSLIEFDQPRPVNGVSGQVLWEGLGEDPVFGAVNDDVVTLEMVQRERPELEYGTPAYDDHLRGKAVDAIADHPLAWGRLLAERTVDATILNRTDIPAPLLDEGGPAGPAANLVNGIYPRLLKWFDPLLFLAAAASAVWLWLAGARRRQVLLLASVFAATALPVVVLSGHKLRYMLPATFALMVLAGVGLDATLERFAARIRSRRAEASG